MFSCTVDGQCPPSAVMDRQSQATQQAPAHGVEDDGDWGEFACAPGVQPITLKQPPEEETSESSLPTSTNLIVPTSHYLSPDNPVLEIPSASPIPSRTQSNATKLSPALPIVEKGVDSSISLEVTDLSEDAFASFDNAPSSHDSSSSPGVTPAEYAAAAASTESSPATLLMALSEHQGGAIIGFDTLNPVQAYAVGALAVVLLREFSTDMNGLAFARAHVANILSALRLAERQQTALFALSPAKEDRQDVVNQCVDLVGDSSTRFRVIQAMLALAVARGVYDARSRAFLCSVASAFGVAWGQVAAVELAIAIELVNQVEVDVSNGFLTPPGVIQLTTPKTAGDIMAERRRRKQKVKRVMKVGGITLVGGILFGVTGGIIAPALLSALAGVGVASAAGLAASGSVASGAVVGSLFGVAGAGVTQGKARKRTLDQLEEFDFERPDDPRVVEEKQRQAEREVLKLAKQQHEEHSDRLIVAPQLITNGERHDEVRVESATKSSVYTSGPDYRPPQIEQSNIESALEPITDEEHATEGKKKKKQKREKLIVGSKGLEAAGHIPSLHICICVPAWLNERRYGSSLRQFEDALKAELPCSQHIALRWESRRLFEMGLAFAKFWASKATVTTIQNAYPHAVAAASSVAGAVAFAFALPLTVLSCLDYIDNPWSVLVSLSNSAAEDLADVLVARSYGQRPVTLFGYSIGARVIFKCLESLASRGALGIVDNVFLLSAPVSADPKRWEKIRPVVAGRIVNGYGTMDWALAFFHRGCGHGVYVSGLRAVELDGVENLNMSYIGLEGHKELKDIIPRAMRAMGVGRGYISLPPAKVLTRSAFTKSLVHSTVDYGNHSSDKEGDVRNQLEHPEKETNRDSSSTKFSKRYAQTEDPSFWQSTGVHIEDMPSRKGMEKAEAMHDKEGDEKEAEKKKGRSWYNIGSWGLKSSGKSKDSLDSKRSSTSSNQEIDASLATNMMDLIINSASADESQVGVRSRTSQDSSNTKPSSETRKKNSPERASLASTYASESNSPKINLGVKTVWDNDSDDELAVNKMRANEVDEHRNGPHVGNDHAQGESGFDWELQRRIWEEQERQLNERGFADDAFDIETGNKVVLGIGIEIAGVRIHPFISQDSELPVSPVVELFTNCCYDQKGLAVRIFEHEKKRRTLPLNPLRQERKYPKLLGEVELTWSKNRSRAECRFAVSVEVNTKGDVIVQVSERFRDGTMGLENVFEVPRSKLCTMRERLDIETKENSLLLLTSGESASKLAIKGPS